MSVSKWSSWLSLPRRASVWLWLTSNGPVTSASINPGNASTISADFGPRMPGKYEHVRLGQRPQPSQELEQGDRADRTVRRRIW